MPKSDRLSHRQGRDHNPVRSREKGHVRQIMGAVAVTGRGAGAAGNEALPEAAENRGCEACGRMPSPPRTRLTVANLAMMVPMELVFNAAAVNMGLPFVLKVLLLTVATSVLTIWVAEPSMMRLLHQWLHAPTLRRNNHLQRAPTLWRIRTVLDDVPGALEDLARSLARAHVNILDIQVHPSGTTVRDELVVSAPQGASKGDLAAIVLAGGGRDIRIWPTTALALADTATQALSLALRVAVDSTELPLAVAELLRAQILDDSRPRAANDGTVLEVAAVRIGTFRFVRPGEPFTPAERARASRLVELADLANLDRRAGTVSTD